MAKYNIDIEKNYKIPNELCVVAFENNILKKHKNSKLKNGGACSREAEFDKFPYFRML